MTHPHNSAHWLEVRYLPGGGHGMPAAPAWYVVRTCPCHRGERVTHPHRHRSDAERAMRTMLEVTDRLRHYEALNR